MSNSRYGRGSGPRRLAVVVGVLLTVLVAGCSQPRLPAATSPSLAQRTETAAAGLTDCVSLPSRCGYPDATNTGVPAGTTLLRVPQDRTSGTGWTWDSHGWISTTDNGLF